MLLEGKTAVVYGAGGSIGRAVAKAFAQDGARLFLTGRTEESVQMLAKELEAEHAQVDATDPDAVEAHFATVVGRTGGVDISFNLISIDAIQGKELTVLGLDDYLRPIHKATRSHFITATTAARHMANRRRGVIMALTATPARLALPLVGGFGTAMAAIEGMMRTLAAELGPEGVRVVWLRSAGSPESFDSQVPVDSAGQPIGNEYLDTIRNQTLLKRFPRVSEIAEAATLLASDRASAITAGTGNVTCGEVVD